jgi:D-xylose 1-dehydrogenase (NADP+, D-xylono-1,5-lactone-forming)
MNTSNTRIRFGIMGLARIARNEFIPAILKSSNASLEAIASGDSSKIDDCKKHFKCNSYHTSYDALLDNSNVDAIYIPLPNSLHKEWAIKAMQKGKHVLCEKPLGLNAAECAELMEVSKKYNKICIEAFMYRYTDRIKKVSELINSKVIGDIKQIHSTFRFMLDKAGAIRLQPELGGGSLYDVGCYPVNLLGMIMNDIPESVKTEYITSNGVDVQFTGVMKYKSGVIATVNCGFNAFFEMHTRITGTEGILDIPDTFAGKAGSISVITANGTREVAVSESDRFLCEVENFSNALLGKPSWLLSLDETLQNAKVIDMLRGQ